MSAEAKNFEAITKAKADHNAKCPSRRTRCA